MRTGSGRTRTAGVLVALAAGLLGLGGCRQTCGQCHNCDTGVGSAAVAAAAAPAAALPTPVVAGDRYGGQRTCPVTGEALPAEGAVPVTAKGQTVYVCCRGCAAKLARDPDRYLAKALAEQVAAGGPRP